MEHQFVSQMIQGWWKQRRFGVNAAMAMNSRFTFYRQPTKDGTIVTIAEGKGSATPYSFSGVTFATSTCAGHLVPSRGEI
mmetsp:Transcript_26238/g.86975  ORF Transcript_26238/g.86975 Transcript_26238/m.86975 type:complete len:80 (+) Transcript_26238:2202-2441(+)